MSTFINLFNGNTFSLMCVWFQDVDKEYPSLLRIVLLS